MRRSITIALCVTAAVSCSRSYQVRAQDVAHAHRMARTVPSEPVYIPAVRLDRGKQKDTFIRGRRIRPTTQQYGPADVRIRSHGDAAIWVGMGMLIPGVLIVAISGGVAVAGPSDSQQTGRYAAIPGAVLMGAGLATLLGGLFGDTLESDVPSAPFPWTIHGE